MKPSSSISSLTFTPTHIDAGTLNVTFLTGEVYEFLNVKNVTVAAMLEAESVGKFFNTFIRDSHSYERLS
jgi:hypothetical protein